MVHHLEFSLAFSAGSGEKTYRGLIQELKALIGGPPWSPKTKACEIYRDMAQRRVL